MSKYATKFEVVDRLPNALTCSGKPKNGGFQQQVIDELLQHPGQWVRIMAGPKDHEKSMRSMARYIRKRDERVEISGRTIDDTFVMFARIHTNTTKE